MESRVSTVMILKKMDTPTFNKLASEANLKYPFIIQDTFHQDPDIKNWRVMPAHNGRQLWASASAAPNERSLRVIRERVCEATEGKAKKTVIVNLRQESHAYLNGHAINYTGRNNWINLGVSHEKAIMAEEEWLQSLKSMRQAVLHSDPRHLEKGQADSIHAIDIERVQSAGEFVIEAGLHYFRLTVADHRAPCATQVDRFLMFLDQLEEGTWLHFHCRGGAGRSSTFLVMHFMLHFANQLSFDEIIQLNSRVTPNYDLSRGSLQNTNYAEFYKQRYEFLQRFYDFANARLNGCLQNWSQWVADPVVPNTDLRSGDGTTTPGYSCHL